MIELPIGIIFGGIASWIIARAYYKKSKFNVPAWAKPIIKKLPQEPPSQQGLLELFRDSVSTDEVKTHPVLQLLQHTACPVCKAPASDFKKEVVGHEYQTILVVECPHCGWSEHGELKDIM